MDIYLLCGLVVLNLIVLLILLFSRSKGGGDVSGLSERLSGENARTRQELMGMLESYRSSVSGLEGRVAESLEYIRRENGEQLDRMRASLAQTDEQVKVSLDRIRMESSHSLELIRQNNEQKMDAMRSTFDQRLQSSISSSFEMVSSQLNEVHKGLGEVQQLASGVGDLKRIMSNIKSRGIVGEIQAKSILEDIMYPGQYVENAVCRPGDTKRVEFALKLPGTSSPVLLPIDCKFPREDFERLLTAQEEADKTAISNSLKALEKRVADEAGTIRSKYIEPPYTTDFAILFLPSEGLYAEVLRIPGLVERVQRDSRVVIAGPSTLAAILNSLQMGFRTLAIEKRSEEVWNTLSLVKSEFLKFGEELDKGRKNVETLANTLSRVSTRTRVMERKLKDVSLLPESEETVDFLE